MSEKPCDCAAVTAELADAAKKINATTENMQYTVITRCGLHLDRSAIESAAAGYGCELYEGKFKHSDGEYRDGFLFPIQSTSGFTGEYGAALVSRRSARG